MSQSLENLDFAQSSNGESIFFLLGVDSLESNNLVGDLVLADKDTSVGSLADLVFFLKYIDIPKDNRRHDRDMANFGALGR